MRNILNRIKSNKIRAIYDDDLIPMLEKAGLLCQIEQGQIRCKFSDEVITLDNLEGIIPTKSGYDFVSATAIRNNLVGHGF